MTGCPWPYTIPAAAQVGAQNGFCIGGTYATDATEANKDLEGGNKPGDAASYAASLAGWAYRTEAMLDRVIDELGDLKPRTTNTEDAGRGEPAP